MTSPVITVDAEAQVGHLAVGPFMILLDDVEATTGVRFTLTKIRRRLFGVRFTIDCTGTRAQVIAAGRELDRRLGK